MSKLWVKFGRNNSVKVSTEGCQDVNDFIGACKKELSPHFDAVAIDQLSLSTTDSGPPLEPDDPIPPQNTAKTPLFISIIDCSAQGIVGSLTAGSRSSSDSLKAPHPKRKERWVQLNEIIEKNKKRSKTADSTGYSYVKWHQIEHVLPTTPYVQSSKAIPDTQFNLLSQYLSFATKCFEEDLDGNFLKAHGHFEFVLRRGNKRVCIVEAKRDDLSQGMAQDLLGCEVAAEICHLDLVYGIVTNYVQWNFLRSLDEKIELDECIMDMDATGPFEASLLKITGKIYAMLSDE